MFCVVVQSLLWSCSLNRLKTAELVVTASFQSRWSWELAWCFNVSGRAARQKAGTFVSSLWVGSSDHPHHFTAALINQCVSRVWAPSQQVLAVGWVGGGLSLSFVFYVTYALTISVHQFHTKFFFVSMVSRTDSWSSKRSTKLWICEYGCSSLSRTEKRKKEKKIKKTENVWIYQEKMKPGVDSSLFIDEWIKIFFKSCHATTFTLTKSQTYSAPLEILFIYSEVSVNLLLFFSLSQKFIFSLSWRIHAGSKKRAQTFMCRYPRCTHDASFQPKLYTNQVVNNLFMLNTFFLTWNYIEITGASDKRWLNIVKMSWPKRASFVIIAVTALFNGRKL